MPSRRITPCHTRWSMSRALTAVPMEDRIIVVNLSGRGDKDMENIRNYKVNHGQTF